MNVSNYLHQSAARYPERLAYAWGDRTWTYAQTQQRVQALASAMQALGIVKGDRVALLMLNCPQLAESLLACLHLGVCAVPLNARLHPAEVPYYLNNSQAVAAVIGPQFAPAMEALRDECPTVRHYICLAGPAAGQLDYEGLIQAHAHGAVAAVEVDPQADLGWLFYTSGTTGKPKGAMLTHAVLNFMTVAYLADLLGIGPEDATLHAAPMTHGSGLHMFAALARGSANVIPASQRFDPPEVLAEIERWRITNLFLSPTMIRMLLNEPALNRHDLSSLCYVVYGGSVIHLEDLKAAVQRFGPVLVQIFGQGETPMTGTFLPREEHVLGGAPVQEKRLLSAGVARTGMETRIVGADDQELPCGELGELVLRGPAVMAGYWSNPAATAETLRHGWLHTGDLAFMDEGGYVFVMDRLRDVIISGGANIYPREVEEVLLRHPAVHEVAVIGIPDRLWGESVHAVVVCAPGAEVSGDDLIEFCKARLASYKKPKSVSFSASIPKNAYGKVLKRELRAPFWEVRARQV